jgi:hypothetical protein
MGYLKSFVANAQNGHSTTLRLDRDTHTVIVRRLKDGQTDYRLRAGAPEIVNATIRNHSGNLEDVIKRCTLGDLAAHSQYGGAPIVELIVPDGQQDDFRALMNISEGLALPTVGKALTVFPIDLTADGKCVGVTAEEDFVFSFEGLIDGAIYDFVTLEGEETGTNILRYETLNMLQDQRERDLDVDNMIAIVFPNSAAFKRLLLTFGNKRISKYSLDELRWMAAQRNPYFLNQTFGYANSRDLMSVFADVLAWPLHSVKRIEMDTDGTALSFLTVYNRSRLIA